jgi:hypothetical protein
LQGRGVLQRVKSGTRKIARWLATGSTLRQPGELPDALIIGAQKAGTTSLFSYLAQHPDVSVSRAKEVHYFDNAFDKGENWYRSHFERGRGDEVFIEASPYYLYHPLAPARSSALLPRAKLIVLLREPVARALSHYQHVVDHGFEPLSFEEAIASETRRLGGSEERLARGQIARSLEHQRYSYRSRGLYAYQIERWLEYFPASAFLFLKAEEMFASPQPVFDRVCDFLGVPTVAIPDSKPRHQRSYPPMAEGVREELSRFYAEPNRRVAELTGIEWS